jgi:hypothetical protein
VTSRRALPFADGSGPFDAIVCVDIVLHLRSRADRAWAPPGEDGSLCSRRRASPTGRSRTGRGRGPWRYAAWDPRTASTLHGQDAACARARRLGVADFTEPVPLARTRRRARGALAGSCVPPLRVQFRLAGVPHVISVVMPVKDGGSDLVRCLEAIALPARRRRGRGRRRRLRLDGRQPRACTRGGRACARDPTQEFDHGGTRNLGAELARGDVLVFTTQDAYAANERWLAALVAPLRGEGVAGVYGRQLPHVTARPPEQFFLDFLYGPRPRVQRLESADDLSFVSTLFSNVNSAIPRHVWEEHRFADDIVMSEDQEWSRRVLVAGMTILYEPRAAVFHSHRYTVAGAFRRFFDSGVSAERSYVSDAPGSQRALGTPPPSTRVARCRGSGEPDSAAGSRTRPSTRPRSTSAFNWGAARSTFRWCSSAG